MNVTATTILIVSMPGGLVFGAGVNWSAQEGNPGMQRDGLLLSDNRIIESTKNAKLTVVTVRKDKRNPLFAEDKPLERGQSCALGFGNHLQIYATRVFYHEGVYIGLAAIYNSDEDHIHTEPAWSPTTITGIGLIPAFRLLPTARKKAGTIGERYRRPPTLYSRKLKSAFTTEVVTIISSSGVRAIFSWRHFGRTVLPVTNKYLKTPRPVSPPRHCLSQDGNLLSVPTFRKVDL